MPESESQEEIRDVEPEQAISIPTGKRHRVRLPSPSFVVVLPVDPGDRASYDDRFILRGEGGSGSYEQEKTIKDDLVEGDEMVTLEFTDLVPDLLYTLEIDLGQGDHYFRFRELHFDELIRMDPRAGDHRTLEEDWGDVEVEGAEEEEEEPPLEEEEEEDELADMRSEKPLKELFSGVQTSEVLPEGAQ